ncbi:MAG TPA: hypothetical protein VKP60_14830 [Magnetospirillaceae bacterium]|nr:hypothetical protein [Magnetospirillaceae bacterium]
MNKEEFDKIISGAMPPVAITDERLDHFIDAVLDRAAQEPRKGLTKQGRTWKVWTGGRWPTLVPALRFALPLAVAVVLGITLGGQYEEDWPVAQFSTLYLSTTLVPVGS